MLSFFIADQKQKMLQGKVDNRKVKTKSVQMAFNVMHGGMVACNLRKENDVTKEGASWTQLEIFEGTNIRL